MGYEEYTWQKYYEDLYHRQKKVNNELAVKLGETESKAAELEFALNRVINSPFWRALSPARKLVSAFNRNGAENASQSLSNSLMLYNSNEEQYQKRIAEYEDYYGQWIKKDENEQLYTGIGTPITECVSLDSCESTFVYHIIEDMTSDSLREAQKKSRKNYADINSNNDEYYITDNNTDYISDNSAGNNSCSDTGDNTDNCIKENITNVTKRKWHIFAPRSAYLADGFEKRLNLELTNNTDAVFGYTDEDYFCYTIIDSDDKDNHVDSIKRYSPNMKPDWSPDTLDSFFYFGNIAFIREDLFFEIETSDFDDGWKNVYDLFLKASERVGKHFDDHGVLHISQILVHIEEPFDPELDYSRNFNEKIIGDTKEYNDIKLQAISRRCKEGLLPQIDDGSCELISGQDPDQYHILYRTNAKKLVSVLILSKDHPELVKTCLSSFIDRTDTSNIDLEFIVVDNGSSDENKHKYEVLLDDILVGYKHKYIYQPMEFNFSRMCNIAAKNAEGDLLLFMNDDMEIVQKDWLSLMVGYASLPHVGAVGAKLLYANTDKIQHIGVTSLEIGPSHKLVIYPDDKSYYYGKNMLTHNMLCVTAACILIDKIKFKQIDGFNEEFAVAYNDVDLCMKLIEAGYECIQCNGALLYHYESMSRGLDADSDDKWKRLLQEKNRLYNMHGAFYKHDPYYNINLIGNHSNYWSNFDFGYNNHLNTESVRQLDARKLAEYDSSNYKISIDFAGTQLKHNLEEPDITEFRGWCFESGSDNFELSVNLFLVKVIDEKENRDNNGKNDEQNLAFEVQTNVMPREDVEEIFKGECHVRLCGFVTKIITSDIPKGTYKVGVEPFRLKHDLTAETQNSDQTRKVIFTDTFITI